MRHFLVKFILSPFVVVFLSVPTGASTQIPGGDEEFGPVVKAYLGYLRSEQEVVDDRVSRHEVSRAYYRRNSNRIRALRQIAIRIARESQNDYLPELEAVSRDELGTIFQLPPRPENLRIGEVSNSTFRFLGPVRSGETFYVFARLDPYEQAEILGHVMKGPASVGAPASGSRGLTRARSATSP
ncbi:MAG: hypothetical protein ACR2G5_13205 [Pyrinomonadaceae bacterium]